MRWTSVVSVCGIAVCCTAEKSVATVPLSEGMAPFGFGIECVRQPGTDSTFAVRVIVSGQYDSSAVAETRIVIPQGLELVAGDTLFRGRVSPDPRDIRTLTLRVRGQGTYTIRGILSVTGPHVGRDEGEVEAMVTLSTDSLQLGACRTVRLEHVRGGQRYRYGRSYLVPIAAPERFTEDDLLEAGQRARVTRQTAAKCPRCMATDPEGMAWVVFVAADGHVIDAHPLDRSTHDPAAVKAGRAALDNWSFAAAQVRGQAVNDWMIVQVRVSK